MKKSVMWQYISEEPKILNNLLNTSYLKVLQKYAHIQSIYFIAHGSSYNASISISEFISKVAQIKTHTYTPATIMKSYQLKLENKKETLIVAISQTGTSRGVLESVEHLKKQGFSILGITGVKDSKLDQLSDTTLYMECGEEDSNAKTKGYSATLLLLMLLGLNLAQIKKTLSNDEIIEIKNSLKEEINLLPVVEKQMKEWCNKQNFENIENLYVLSYGMNYGTAMEAQLKLMETMCIPTMYNDIVEFSHGMHRSIHKNSTVWLLSFKDEMSDLTYKTYEYLKKKTNVLLIHADENEIKDTIHIKYFKYDASILLMTLVLQILSVYIPESHLLDPNAYANDDYTDYVQTRI